MEAETQHASTRGPPEWAERRASPSDSGKGPETSSEMSKNVVKMAFQSGLGLVHADSLRLGAQAKLRKRFRAWSQEEKMFGSARRASCENLGGGGAS